MMYLWGELWDYVEKEKLKEINSALYLVNSKSINNISELLEGLKLGNIHQYFYVFCYLLWNGYFSIDKIYAYNNSNILDEENTIFLGRGCCRHNAILLAKVKSIYEMGVRTTKIRIEELMNIEDRVECNDESTKFEKNDCDHSIVLAKDNGGLFLLDPTNLTECEVIKNGKLICFNGKYKVNRKMFVAHLKDTLHDDYPYNKFATIDKSILVDSYKNAKILCKENHQLFDDFYDENHSNYEKIKQLVLSKTNLF